MLFTNTVNIVCACMHSRVFMLHENCWIMGNSFCMNSFWGSLKLNLPSVPKLLRPALPSTLPHWYEELYLKSSVGLKWWYKFYYPDILILILRGYPDIIKPLLHILTLATHMWMHKYKLRYLNGQYIAFVSLWSHLNFCSSRDFRAIDNHMSHFWHNNITCNNAMLCWKNKLVWNINSRHTSH